ncbi:MAG: hypothetical protein PWQ97_907 [Tepidanaerobacteraceae bacterium]|nr:hypothetical protein [Tepidanaerobacteraceae bacterium]
MAEESPSTQFLPFEKGLLSEFRINQHTTSCTLSASPVVLASTVVMVDDVDDRVWLNGTVNWQVSLNIAGSVDILFEILRGSTVIYSAVQSITTFLPVLPFTVYNQAQLQHVDTTPISTPGLTPVLYQLRATVISTPSIGTVSTLSQILSAAEIEAVHQAV